MHAIKSGRIVKRNDKRNHVHRLSDCERFRKCREAVAPNKNCRKSEPAITKTIKDSLKYVLNIINETNVNNRSRTADKYEDEMDDADVTNGNNIVSYNQAVVSYHRSKHGSERGNSNTKTHHHNRNNSKIVRSTRHSLGKLNQSVTLQFELDPNDTFFSLMSATVKNFSTVDQHHVKNSVFTLINEIEGKNLKLLSPPVENCKMCTDKEPIITPNSGPAVATTALPTKENKTTAT